MSRPARPLGTPLGVVALLAVLAITVGWNLPPQRPLEAGLDVGLAAALDDAAVDRLDARIAAAATQRATARDRAWEVRAAADDVATSDPVGSGEPVAPVDDADAPAAPTRPTEGARAAVTVTLPSGKTRTYSGRNHLWIPSLGMSDAVVAFPCPRKRPPDNFMYRWGCAKKNNVYLLGHAYSVMKPLHDAYVGGRLRVGMVAVYADGEGRIRAYRVTEWRVVDPAEGVHWAIAAQPVPSMTLQTCVGKYSQWRLNVRLVAID